MTGKVAWQSCPGKLPGKGDVAQGGRPAKAGFLHSAVCSIPHRNPASWTGQKNDALRKNNHTPQDCESRLPGRHRHGQTHRHAKTGLPGRSGGACQLRRRHLFFSFFFFLLFLFLFFFFLFFVFLTKETHRRERDSYSATRDTIKLGRSNLHRVSRKSKKIWGQKNARPPVPPAESWGQKFRENCVVREIGRKPKTQDSAGGRGVAGAEVVP